MKKTARKFDFFKTFISAMLAGIAICIGTVAYLSVNNKLVGAFAFSVGLFIVLTNKYLLFTGSVCYVTDKGEGNILRILTIFAGNVTGAFAAGSVMGLTRIVDVCTKAKDIVEMKATDSLLSIFVLAVLCNIMIYNAVNSYKRNPYEMGKYLAILLCVPIFVICSYEHCIANMCYIAIGRCYSKVSFVMLAVTIIGNTISGIVIHLLTKYANK